MRRFFLACGLAVLTVAVNAGTTATTATTANTANARPQRIDGISAFEPLPAAAVTPRVVDHEMEVRWQGGRVLRVAPWPSFLPRHFGRQTVAASRTMFPSGPADRVSFTCITEKQPWLAAGNGARPASRLIGGWHLRRAGAGWAVADGSQVKHWSAAGPVSVPVGRERWCLYLLDTGAPQARAGIATEGEPQVAWAARKLDARRHSCPAQR